MLGDVGYVVGLGRDLTGMALASGMELFSLRRVYLFLLNWSETYQADDGCGRLPYRTSSICGGYCSELWGLSDPSSQ